MKMYRDEHMSLAKIGEKFGTSRQNVAGILEARGIKRRSREKAAFLRRLPKIACETCSKKMPAKKNSSGETRRFCSSKCYGVSLRSASPEMEKAMTLVSQGVGYQRSITVTGANKRYANNRSAVTALWNMMRVRKMRVTKSVSTLCRSCGQEFKQPRHRVSESPFKFLCRKCRKKGSA